jgi:hypothetical protein
LYEKLNILIKIKGAVQGGHQKRIAAVALNPFCLLLAVFFQLKNIGAFITLKTDTANELPLIQQK